MFSVPLFMFIFTLAYLAYMVSYLDCEMLWLLTEWREEGLSPHNASLQL